MQKVKNPYFPDSLQHKKVLECFRSCVAVTHPKKIAQSIMCGKSFQENIHRYVTAHGPTAKLITAPYSLYELSWFFFCWYFCRVTHLSSTWQLRLSRGSGTLCLLCSSFIRPETSRSFILMCFLHRSSPPFYYKE